MFCIALIISFGSCKFISIDIFISLFTIFLRRNSITIFIDIFCYYFCWSSSFLLVDVNSITVFISCSFYKLIAIYILLRIVTLCRLGNFISIFVYIFSNYLCSRRSSLLFVDMFCITLFIFFGFYKFISFDLFISLCTIFLRSNSLTIFINIFCNYICRWCDFLVDMFCISLFIFFGSYKFISRNIFFVFCSIFLWSNSLTILIDVFCYYFCRWCDFLVDMFCISLFISFGSYKFISIYVFFVFCSSFLWSNSITIFINVFCNYISIWGEFPCSCDFFVFVSDFY